MSALKSRLKVLQPDPDDDKCLTFILKDEDHTLGNALRYVITKNPKVQFCGYAIPHPSEKEINFRIHTSDGPAADAFKKGLEDLEGICDHVTKTFKAAQEEHDKATSAKEEEIITLEDK